MAGSCWREVTPQRRALHRRKHRPNQIWSGAISGAHARHVARLPWFHRDPFDRMRIAQAQSEQLVSLTADERFTHYGGFVRLVR